MRSAPLLLLSNSNPLRWASSWFWCVMIVCIFFINARHVGAKSAPLRFKAVPFWGRLKTALRSLAPPFQTGPAALGSGLGSGADRKAASFLSPQSKRNDSAQLEQSCSDEDRFRLCSLYFYILTAADAFDFARLVPPAKRKQIRNLEAVPLGEVRDFGSQGRVMRLLVQRLNAYLAENAHEPIMGTYKLYKLAQRIKEELKGKDETSEGNGTDSAAIRQKCNLSSKLPHAPFQQARIISFRSTVELAGLMENIY